MAQNSSYTRRLIGRSSLSWYQRGNLRAHSALQSLSHVQAADAEVGPEALPHSQHPGVVGDGADEGPDTEPDRECQRPTSEPSAQGDERAEDQR